MLRCLHERRQKACAINGHYGHEHDQGLGLLAALVPWVYSLSEVHRFFVKLKYIVFV